MTKRAKLLIKLVWIGFIFGTVSFIILFFSVKYDVNGYFGDMPGIEFVENPSTELSSTLYTADGETLGKYYRENRTNVDYDEISPYVINGLISTEDERFNSHSGIDLRSLGRVVFGMLTLSPKGGGSTISQQLAKNIFQLREDDKYKGPAYQSKLAWPTRKIKEWIMSTKLERTYTKEEIISLYLNTVTYGNNTFGIRNASQTYFGVHPYELKIEEAAVLVGVLKGNSVYDPKRKPEKSKARRNTVLMKMQQAGHITMEEKDSLQSLPLTLNFEVENHINGLAPYFRAQVKKELSRWCKLNSYDLYGDGLKIYTSIDANLQSKAEDAVNKHMRILQKKFFEHWKGRNPWTTEAGSENKKFFQNRVKRTPIYRSLKKRYKTKPDSIDYFMNLKKKMTVLDWDGPKDTVMSRIDSIGHYLKFLHVGMSSIDPETGQIKAWVGGINFKYFKKDHVNGSMNQAGSTFKPFLYLAALDHKNMSPCDSVLDEVVMIPTGDGKFWSPPNYSKKNSHKNYTLRQGLAESKNVIAGKVMSYIGADMLIDYARRCGIKSKLDAVPSLCLGTSDVNVLEMTSSYSTFVNKGWRISPTLITRIEDKDGNLLAEFKPSKKKTVSTSSAQKMCYMLQGATSREYKNEKGWPTGTAMRLRGKNAPELGGDTWGFTNEIGGKTGTTNNAADGWFMGITPNLVTGVWVGADYDIIHFRGGSLAQGSRLAMPIFGHYMKEVYADSTSGIDPIPFPIEVREVGVKYCAKVDSLVPLDSTQVEEPILFNDDQDQDGI